MRSPPEGPIRGRRTRSATCRRRRGSRQAGEHRVAVPARSRNLRLPAAQVTRRPRCVLVRRPAGDLTPDLGSSRDCPAGSSRSRDASLGQAAEPRCERRPAGQGPTAIPAYCSADPRRPPRRTSGACWRRPGRAKAPEISGAFVFSARRWTRIKPSDADRGTHRVALGRRREHSCDS